MGRSAHTVTLAEPPEEARVAASVEHGAFVGRYVVLSRVGEGAMGVVYMAHDPELGRVVAIKLVQPSREYSSDSLARLTREAQAMAKLNHPNVVPIHDVGEHDGGVFLAMEFVEGPTLRAWLSAKRRARKDVLAVLRQAGEGLAAAHAKGLAHRDFKPDNVIIGDDGRVRVADFGLARLAGDARSDNALQSVGEDARADVLGTALTHEGTILGTPRYMAPEQLRGEEAGASADQFAFCLTLYEALYGQPAFAGDSLSALRVSVTRGSVRPAPPGTRVPTWLRRVLLRGLDSAPHARWPSMRALLVALDRDPMPRRRAAWGVASLVSIAVATAGWAGWDEAQRIKQCDLEGATIESAWNPSVRQAVRTAMLATGVAHAEASFERTAATLDDYTTQWTEVRGTLCRAAHVERSLPESRYALASGCLDDLGLAVDELVRLLAAATDTIVHGSVSAATGLAGVATCSDLDRLARRPVQADELRETTSRLREQLAQVATLRAVGDYEAAREEAQAALATAEAQGAVLHRARALVDLGRAEFELGHFDEASDRLVAAVEGAGALGDDEIAAEAALLLAYVVGSMQGRVDEGLLWSRQADMWLDRMATAPGDPRRGIAALFRATVLEERGDWTAALAELERALALVEASYGPHHPETARILQALAELQHMTGDHAASLENMERSLAARERVYGSEHPEVATALAAYGSILSGTGRKPEAVESLRRALAIRESALGPRHPSVAHSLYNLAYAVGPTDEAVALLERAVLINERALGPGHPDVATCISDLGMIALERGDANKALAQFSRATEIVEVALGTEHPLFARMLFNRGAAERALGEFTTARATFDYAAEVSEAALPGGSFTAEAWEAAGLACLSVEDRVCAIDRLEQAVSRYQQAGPADYVAIAQARLDEALRLRAAR